MATRSFYDGGQGDPVSWFRGKVARIEDGTDKALEQAVEDGAAIMKEMIETRGTGKTWSRPGPSGRTGSSPGRVDSGEMRDAVTSYFNPGTAKGNAVGQFGWRTGRKDYFGLQEGGFQHTSGVYVEGMYAMVDSAELAWTQFQRDAGEAMKNA